MLEIYSNNSGGACDVAHGGDDDGCARGLIVQLVLMYDGGIGGAV